MRKTRKWAFVKQEAERLAALGLTPLEIAQRLEVAKSTVNRWIKTGKLVRGIPVTGGIGPAIRQSPTEWAETVRQTYSLDATDSQLVTLAEQALVMARDDLEPASVRMLAMGRFQALVKQLALVARMADQEPIPERPQRPEPRRPTVDPRNVLRAV